MPTAALRPCATCGVVGCLQHQRAARAEQEQRRGTAHARGYTYRAWQPFRRQFLAALVHAGIPPICGAALPDGPQARDSACRDAGLFTYTSADGSSLHLDHEPPLADWERAHAAIVCDLHRIVLLCRSCHTIKTAKERGEAGR